MPFDSYTHLVSQGWSGRGNGLRQGAISKPIIQRYRRGQGGVGVDRDDAAPFWDHIYTAAAQSIHINVSNDSDDSDDDENAELTKPETSTNLRKRSQEGTNILAKANSCVNTGSPSLNMLLSISKRNAARKVLYEKFSRGQTLGPVAALEGHSMCNDHKTSSKDMSLTSSSIHWDVECCTAEETSRHHSTARTGRQFGTERATDSNEGQSKTPKKRRKRKKQ